MEGAGFGMYVMTSYYDVVCCLYVTFTSQRRVAQQCVVEDRGNISSRFLRNSEACASEFLRNLEEKFPDIYF